MPNLSSLTTQQKIAIQLRERNLRVSEIVAVTWDTEELPRYYCHNNLSIELSVDERSALANLIDDAPIEVRLMHGAFSEITQSGAIADDEVSLQLYDGDDAISDLVLAHGEGVRVEFFLYLPDFNLLLSQFWGHLKLPESARQHTIDLKAAQGFRSPLLPLPRRAFYTGCQAIFGDEDCGYNRHTGGSVGLLNGGSPFTSCPRTKAACIARFGDALTYLAFEFVIDTKVVSQTKGPNLSASTRGNESNLKRPMRVVYGHRIVRDLDLGAYRPEPNTNHPDKAALSTLFFVSEGPIQQQWNHRVANQVVKYTNIQIRNGQRRQSSSGFSANVPNYSGTALFYSDVFGDWRNVSPDQIQAECEVEGRNTIRVYSSATAYTEQYTTNRAWCLLDMLRNHRYGHGMAFKRFHFADWLTAANFCAETLSFTDANGNSFSGLRSTFNADLGDRTAQQQIKDTCLWGRLSLPFVFNGELRIIPLTKVVLDDSIPLFTDEGDDRNIIVENGQPLWEYSQKSDTELPNFLSVSFDDEEYGFTERPVTVEDVDQQLRAGRAFGDETIRRVEKQYGAFGITNLREALWCAQILLDLGEFDEGGIKNNLRVKLTTWSVLANVLNLHPYAIVKLRIKKLEKYGFEYFRIIKMVRKANLQMELTLQAYPVDYYEDLENAAVPITAIANDPTLITQGGIVPNPITFGDVQAGMDYFSFKVGL